MAVKYKQYINSYESLGRKEYYERMVFPERISMFNDMWKSEKNIIPEELSVSFRGLAFGSNPETVSRMMGKPRFVIENHGLSSLIYFYKERINNHRILIQVHFWGMEFFYASYTFRDESDKEREIIKDMLFEKYSAIPNDVSDKNQYLADKDNNIICIHDNVNFHILYLWGDDKIKSAVSQNTYSLRFGKENVKNDGKDDLRNLL